MVHQQRDPRSDESDRALSVLRGIWSARDSTDDVEQRFAATRPKTCKNMKNIGFGGLGADPADDRADEDRGTNTPVDDDARAEWRKQLARDGKLLPGAVSLGEQLRAHGRG